MVAKDKLKGLKGFTFFRSFFESGVVLKEKDRRSLFEAIVYFAFTGEVIEMTSAARACFIAVKPNIESSQAKSIAGAKGGASKKARESEEDAEQSENKLDENTKQVVCKLAASVKQTVSNKDKELDKDKNKSLVLSDSSFRSAANDQTDETETDETHEQIKQRVKEQITYTDFLITHKNSIKLVDEIVAIITDTLLSEYESIVISGVKKDKAVVDDNLLKLEHRHIEYVINNFLALNKRVTKKTKYVLNMLFNSVNEIDLHYTNAVNADNADKLK